MQRKYKVRFVDGKGQHREETRKGKGPFEVKVDLALNHPEATSIEIVPIRTERSFKVQYKTGDGQTKQETKKGLNRGDVRKKVEGKHSDAKGLSVHSIARQ